MKDKELWDKILPLNVGDRVRIKTVSTYDKRFWKPFLGKTGVVTYVFKYTSGIGSRQGRDIHVRLDKEVHKHLYDIHLMTTDVERI